MNKEQILASAMHWMRGRGWRAKLAKSGSGQSLFEHGLIELDVLLELVPVLAHPKHYGLTEAERKILAVSTLIHDVGKETEAWQTYVRTPGSEWVPHIVPELTRSVVPEVCSALGFGNQVEPVQRTMTYCADLHHNRPGRSDGVIVGGMLSGGSDRFLTLAYLVKAIDQFCSAENAAEAAEVGRSSSALGPHLSLATHSVVLRGVSTALLHRAAQQAFVRRGWVPVLYFRSGTVYLADANGAPSVPDLTEIIELLQSEIGAALKRNVAHLMVGSPTGNILPKPDLFSFDEVREYLRTAANEIGPASFARKPLTARQKVVREYWRLRGTHREPTVDEIEQETGRLSSAQPEMVVFKFFKAMTDPDKLDVIGKDGAVIAQRLYEQRFGPGGWADLQSTSTLMPAKDMVKTVDRFWSLPGHAVNHPEVDRVELLPPKVRMDVLVELLDQIAAELCKGIGRSSPRHGLSHAMAKAFSQDLVEPSRRTEARALALDQLQHYCLSKPFAGRDSEKGVYTCPMCNGGFSGKMAVKASADFVDNPQTHTNRAGSHEPFGYIMVCFTCYYERLLRQILMGGRPAEVITLTPRLNFGPERGEQLLLAVRKWVESAQAQMRGDSGNLDSGFSLAFIDGSARALLTDGPYKLEAEDLLSLFRFRFPHETQKTRRREAMRRLREEFDGNLENLNMACSQDFASWEAAVEALVEDRINQQEFKAIRREVFRLYETMSAICRTPNLILIPLRYEVSGNDESETCKAFRRLYVSLLLGIVFEGAVSIYREAEPWMPATASGVAYVPAVPGVRSLVRCEWVPVADAERWLRAIGSASLLVRPTALPARSALYEILSADPAERVARRIDRPPSSHLTLAHLDWIQNLPGFHSTE